MNKREEIQRYIMALEKKAPRMNACGVDFATLGDSDGDSCLFNGLLASVGYHIGNMGVSQSQSQEGEWNPGMFYRSPRRRSYGKEQHGEPYFSRDMALGVLLYFATRDKFLTWRRAKAWLKYIDSTSKCKVKKPKWLGGGCILKTPYYYAPDDRSRITPTMWANMYRVWRHNDWKPTYEMKKYKGIDTDLSVIEAENCDLGYQLHLKAVQAYIKLLTGQSKEYSKRVGQIAYDRIPDNIFYELLANRVVTLSMLDRYLEMRPSLDQDWGHSWLWEKNEVTEARIKKSCGWDFIFLGKLLLDHS
jgi:hypothetical protein